MPMDTKIAAHRWLGCCTGNSLEGFKRLKKAMAGCQTHAQKIPCRQAGEEVAKNQQLLSRKTEHTFTLQEMLPASSGRHAELEAH